MSEFNITCVKIGEITKHTSADTLSITMVHGGYPCIFKTGDFKEGDLAVYIPVDALCPVSNPVFKFLDEGKGKELIRIKARRLRGVFSMGLLIKAPPSAKEGDDLQKHFGIEKYLPPSEQEPKQKKIHKKGTWFSYLVFRFKKLFGLLPPEPPSISIPYYDIEGIRKHGNILQEGEEVVLTEKIHGSCSCFTYVHPHFYIRSREVFRSLESDNYWSNIARTYKLKEKLKLHPNKVLFGEIYGETQDLKYGVPTNEKIRLIAFDVLDKTTNQYLDYDDFLAFCKEIEIPVVPELYRGPWSKDLLKLAEGKSTIPGSNNVREGFVVKPVKERIGLHFGRVILKLHGEGYLTRK